jgi:hypothetical protein
LRLWHDPIRIACLPGADDIGSEQGNVHARGSKQPAAQALRVVVGARQFSLRTLRQRVARLKRNGAQHIVIGRVVAIVIAAAGQLHPVIDE